MARNIQHDIEELIGKQAVQIVALTAQLEDANEKADALQKALDAVPVKPEKLKAVEKTG